jgi:hypothetical protein
VPDEQHALTVALAQQIVEQCTHPLGGLAIALTAGERRVDTVAPIPMDDVDRSTVQVPIVELAKPWVGDDGYVDAGERDLHGLHRPSEVRRKDEVEPVVATSATELRCIGLTHR